jgi:hypothetical protein
MKKDRLIVLTDAVLAIIMTILILELEKPTTPSLEAFWDLRQNFFACFLSFFWLGSLWMALNTLIQTGILDGMKFSKENSCRSKSRNKFHQIISEEIFSTFSHNVFSAIHNDPGGPDLYKCQGFTVSVLGSFS